MCHNGPWFCLLELTGKEWRMFKILINSFILNNLEPLMQKTLMQIIGVRVKVHVTKCSKFCSFLIVFAPLIAAKR